MGSGFDRTAGAVDGELGQLSVFSYSDNSLLV